MGGEQDMRKMGGLRKHLPVTYGTFLAASLALCGFPLFAGFITKDEILRRLRPRRSLDLGGGLWYRRADRVLHVPRRPPDVLRQVPRHPAAASPARIAALDVRSAGGAGRVIGGGRRGDAAGFLADFKPFERFLEPVFSSEFTRHVTKVPITHSTELTFSILAIGMAVAGWFLADLMYRQQVLSPERFSALFSGALYRTVLNKYYVDEFYPAAVSEPLSDAVPRGGLV